MARDLVARNAAILAAFDAGDRAKDIAARLDLTLNTVNGVLATNDRRARQRTIPISHLPADQRRLYDKLRRFGIAPQAARAQAQAIPHPQAVASRFPPAVPSAAGIAPNVPAATPFARTHTQRLPNDAEISPQPGR